MEKKEIKNTEDLTNIQANFKGHEIIKFIAKTLPNQPGVYQMEEDDLTQSGKLVKNIIKNWPN